jgi:hypothetical protein
MNITNKTTIKDVEGCPFIGIVNMPLFNHIEYDEVTTYDPFNFNEHKKVVLKTKPTDVRVFRGNYKDLVENTKAKGGMVYFFPTDDGKIVHKDIHGEYVRMAQVKLSDYYFNQKLRQFAIKVDEPKIETPQKNYKYLLIRR